MKLKSPLQGRFRGGYHDTELYQNCIQKSLAEQSFFCY
jgi:hypothetical protein